MRRWVAREIAMMEEQLDFEGLGRKLGLKGGPNEKNEPRMSLRSLGFAKRPT